MPKVNIVSCELLKDNGSYKTYAIKDTEGKRYGSTEFFENGEQEVEIVINGSFTNLKKPKTGQAKFGTAKDWTFEKKKAALEAASTLGNVDADALLINARAIYEWIKSTS